MVLNIVLATFFIALSVGRRLNIDPVPVVGTVTAVVVLLSFIILGIIVFKRRKKKNKSM